MLVTLVSNASADKTVIDSVTINPTQPFYGQEFTLTVHITNPPIGGWYSCTVGDDTSLGGVLDNTGVVTIGSHIIDAQAMGYPEIPPGYTIWIYDANNNFVTSTGGAIPLRKSTTIPEFPTIALPMVTILGMISIIGRKKE